MIEILTGLLLLAGGAAVWLGLAPAAVPSSAATAAFAGLLGVLLLAHGLYRVRLARPTREKRSARGGLLAGLVVVLTCLLALAAPVAAPFLNGVRVAGFPLGFYLASQGALVGLVMLAFLHAWRATAAESRDASEED